MMQISYADLSSSRYPLLSHGPAGLSLLHSLLVDSGGCRFANTSNINKKNAEQNQDGTRRDSSALRSTISG